MTKINVTKWGPDEYILTRNCIDCGQLKRVKVKTQDYFNWAYKGQHAQNAFPYLNENERELLISGFCGPCFGKIFADKDDATE